MSRPREKQSDGTAPPTQAPPALDSLARQAELLAAGEVSSVTLVERALARAQELQPLLQPFRVILAEQARAEAVRADERLVAGMVWPGRFEAPAGADLDLARSRGV